MKTPLYAFVEFNTNRTGRWGMINDIGYVTKSILKSNKYRSKRVRVIQGGVKGWVSYPRRKDILTIIPFNP